MGYRFTVNGRRVLPNYKNSVALVWGLHGDEQFYRQTLSSPLKFMGGDFEYINNQPFETEFETKILKPEGSKTVPDLRIFPTTGASGRRIDDNDILKYDSTRAYVWVPVSEAGSYRFIFKKALSGRCKIGYSTYPGQVDIQAVAPINGGAAVIQVPEEAEHIVLDLPFDYLASGREEFIEVYRVYWEVLWTGVFFKTDGKWDFNNRIVEMKVEPRDQYTEILAGLENEYNLIELSPKLHKVKMDKRLMYQVYIPGMKRISCFLGANSWEQDVIDRGHMTNTDEGDALSLQQRFKFAHASSYYRAKVSGPTNFGGPEGIIGEYVSSGIARMQGESGPHLSTHYYITIDKFQPDHLMRWRTRIRRANDNVAVYEGYSSIMGQDLEIPTTPFTTQLTEVGGTSKITVEYFGETKVMMRLLTDASSVLGTPTYDIESEDIVADNRNYNKAIGYLPTDIPVVLSTAASVEPTKYGRRPDGKYYRPVFELGQVFIPMLRSAWEYASLWFNVSFVGELIEESARVEYVMNDAILIEDALDVIVKEIDPRLSVDRAGLYQGIQSGPGAGLFITQKSNILAGMYTLAARKAPVKLKELLDAFRDMFQCYWYVEDSKLKAHSIDWFKRGGGVVGADLTELTESRNGKTWAYLTDKIEFDKLEMPERYEFKWADEVSVAFEGSPIEILSKYVERGKVQEVNVPKITTDIDFLLLSPENMSQDGFAMLQAYDSGSGYKVMYGQTIANGVYTSAQNALLSWPALHENYWRYDLPSYNALINEAQNYPVLGIQKKRKQTVNFPTQEGLLPNMLIKTNVGLGKIEKLSVYLHSGISKAELRYDTE